MDEIGPQFLIFSYFTMWYTNSFYQGSYQSFTMYDLCFIVNAINISSLLHCTRIMVQQYNCLIINLLRCTLHLTYTGSAGFTRNNARQHSNMKWSTWRSGDGIGLGFDFHYWSVVDVLRKLLTLYSHLLPAYVYWSTVLRLNGSSCLYVCTVFSQTWEILDCSSMCSNCNLFWHVACHVYVCTNVSRVTN